MTSYSWICVVRVCESYAVHVLSSDMNVCKLAATEMQLCEYQCMTFPFRFVMKQSDY